MADFENHRKRTEREKTDLVTNTKFKMVEPLLQVIDELSIAIKSYNDNGLNMILKKLEDSLSKFGLEQIQTEVYYDKLHEVISILEVGEERIIDVISKGYVLDGKVIKYPKIILGQ